MNEPPINTLRKAKVYEMSNLDALRSFAVLTVMFDHMVPAFSQYLGRDGNALWIRALINVGTAGVLAFFVHTSLVLMYSLERLESRHAHFTLRFYVRRFFRIYPLSTAVILLVVLLKIPSVATGTPDIVNGRIIVANLLLIQNLVTHQMVLRPLWSLPYEVQMYIVLPFLFVLSKHRRSVQILLGMIVLLVAFAVFLNAFTGKMNMARWAPCFVSGVLCYALRRKMRPVIPAVFWPLFVLLLIAGYSYVEMYHPAQIYAFGWFYCFVLGISINLFHDSSVSWWNYICHTVAKYSYGLYLLHVPVLYLVYAYLGIKNYPLSIFMFFTVTFAASALTYHLLESPMIEVGRRLSDLREPQLQTATGAA